jgi:dCMP deaminase
MPMDNSERGEPTSLNNWDKRRLSLAAFVKKWSKDPAAQVGALVVDAFERIVALGYNGFPKGVSDNARLTTREKHDFILHAEENAILIAGERARGGTIYVIGKPVCKLCARLIIQSGIVRVVCQCPDINDESSKWTEKGIIALDMFNEADVPFDFCDEDEVQFLRK